MDGLVISKEAPEKHETNWYTDKPFIYSVEFRYSDLTITQLFDYLNENIRVGQRLELWLIWIDDKQFIQPTICKYKELTLEHLNHMFNWHDEKYINQNCIVIER